uniref:Uncharacterized protein n=1 Tax=Candidatus Kentrum sp. FW TaxID=2126338 RepID=A0A450TTM7_9GAMM|nr:MAG: hypothetical protein BECKFW1821C_GA0114237_103112 [Candidatus Kentron sp. FW]
MPPCIWADFGGWYLAEDFSHFLGFIRKAERENKQTVMLHRITPEMETPIQALFEYPTIKEMADYIGASSLSMELEDTLARG